MINDYLVEKDNKHEAMESLLAALDTVKDFPNNNIKKIYVIDKIKHLMDVYFDKEIFSKREMSDVTAAIQKSTFTPYIMYSSLFNEYDKSEGDLEIFYTNVPLTTMELVSKLCCKFLEIFNEETYLLGEDKDFLTDCMGDLLQHVSDNMGTGQEFKYLHCITRAFKANHRQMNCATDFVEIYLDLRNAMFEEYREYYGESIKLVFPGEKLQEGPFLDILRCVGLKDYIDNPNYSEPLNLAVSRFELVGMGLAILHPSFRSEAVRLISKMLERYGQLGLVVRSCFINGFNDTVKSDLVVDYARALIEFRDFGHIMIVSYNFSEICRMIRYFELFQNLLEPNRVSRIFQVICERAAEKSLLDTLEVYNDLVECNFGLLERSGVVPKGTKEKMKRRDSDEWKRVEI